MQGQTRPLTLKTQSGDDSAVPDLTFRVAGAEAVEFAAVPSLRFLLDIAAAGEETIHAVTLNAQVRILTAQRSYTAEEQERLTELFGPAHAWGRALQSMLWAQASAQVPAFRRGTQVNLPLTCTYDFGVVSAKYLHALEDGEIPLEFLFSGTVFYAGATGLQAAQIPWEKEARFALPVRLWQQTMDHYFPNSAWLRLRRDVFDRLYRYRVRNGLLTWEAALESLLRAEEEGEG